ncbi:unnamed protein product [Periconia digitata]|uniref:Zn(2)-C6 fungal-type domain-containing protein n=1 Tax=Periconia digitata TaxID=1303443 RepID=A0A9W4XZB9_9PLEO|nr:unnamed protein product [Periconia digitata]
MPSGPTSRGCNACRAQKKGCDRQKPVCSRCKRLNLVCVGAGEQRFKFVGTDSKPSNSTKLVPVARTSISPGLDSETTSISSAFIRTLGIGDPSSQLDTITMVNGLFAQIPRRLGSNKALDTASEALMSSYKFVYDRGQIRKARMHYGRALKELSITLQDPAATRSSNTLCAIYLLLICQNWISKGEMQYGNHMEGVCYVLNAFAETFDWTRPRHTYDNSNNLELVLISILTFPLMVEKIYNPRLNFGPWLQKALAWQGPRGKDIKYPYSLGMRNVYQITELVQDPAPHQTAFEIAYDILCEDISIMGQRLADLSISSDGKSGNEVPQQIRALQFVYGMHYGMMLPFACILNSLLRAFPSNQFQPKALEEDAERFVKASIKLARESNPLRPLGTEGIPWVLCFTWALSSDAATQTEIEDLIRMYDSDFMGANNFPVAIWTRRWLEKQTNKIRGIEEELHGIGESDADLEAVIGPGRSCCVM